MIQLDGLKSQLQAATEHTFQGQSLYSELHRSHCISLIKTQIRRSTSQGGFCRASASRSAASQRPRCPCCSSRTSTSSHQSPWNSAELQDCAPAAGGTSHLADVSFSRSDITKDNQKGYYYPPSWFLSYFPISFWTYHSTSGLHPASAPSACPVDSPSNAPVTCFRSLQAHLSRSVACLPLYLASSTLFIPCFSSAEILLRISVKRPQTAPPWEDKPESHRPAWETLQSVPDCSFHEVPSAHTQGYSSSQTSWLISISDHVFHHSFHSYWCAHPWDLPSFTYLPHSTFMVQFKSSPYI